MSRVRDIRDIKGRPRARETITAERRQELLDICRQMHPGFDFICTRCSSNLVGIEDTRGWSPESGSWGDYTLVCLECDNRTDLTSLD